MVQNNKHTEVVDDEQYVKIAAELRRLLEEYHKSSPYSQKVPRFYNAMSGQLNLEISGNKAFPHEQVQNFYLEFYKMLRIDSTNKEKSSIELIKIEDTSRSYLRFIEGVGILLLTVLTLPISVPLIAIVYNSTGRHPLDLFNTYAEQLEKEVNLIEQHQIPEEDREKIRLAKGGQSFFDPPKEGSDSSTDNPEVNIHIEQRK